MKTLLESMHVADPSKTLLVSRPRAMDADAVKVTACIPSKISQVGMCQNWGPPKVFVFPSVFL